MTCSSIDLMSTGGLWLWDMNLIVFILASVRMSPEPSSLFLTLLRALNSQFIIENSCFQYGSAFVCYSCAWECQKEHTLVCCTSFYGLARYRGEYLLWIISHRNKSSNTKQVEWRIWHFNGNVYSLPIELLDSLNAFSSSTCKICSDWPWIPQLF